MIATIDIKVNAAHPNIPLAPLYAFVGSPSSVRVRNVPQRVGKWDITAVSVTIAMPDNSSTTVPAVAVCGCWVATLPSCDETGYCASGLQITASGTDENGNAVTGYCLGVGDVTILPRDATAVSNGTRYYLHYVAEQPENPNPGDMCYIDGAPKWYDGTAWQTFADGGTSIDVVPPSTDPADAGKAADAKATGDALAGKLTRAEAEAGFTEWSVSGLAEGETIVTPPFWVSADGNWYLETSANIYASAGTADSDSLTFSDFSHTITATRTRLPTMADLATKQDTISDLAAIRSGAAAGATAVQPSALAGAVRYDLGAMIGINGDSITTDTSVTPNVDYVSVTLADRTLNRLVINVAFDELRLTFPAKVAGKVRDFGVRVEIDNSSGGTDMVDIALAAPTPTSTETLYIETADGAMPKIKGAAAGASATTILYFTETAEGVFMVKGEEVKEVS